MMEDCDDQFVLPMIMLEMTEQIGFIVTFSTCLKSAIIFALTEMLLFMALCFM